MSATEAQYYALYKENHRILFETIANSDAVCNHPFRLSSIAGGGACTASLDGTGGGATGSLDDYLCDVTIDMTLLDAWSRVFINNLHGTQETLNDFEFRASVERRAPWFMANWETGGATEIECGDYSVTYAGGATTTGAVYAYFEPTIFPSGGDPDSGGRSSETGQEHEIVFSLTFSRDTTGNSGKDFAVDSVIAAIEEGLEVAVYRNPWSDSWADTTTETTDKFDQSIADRDGVNGIAWTGTSTAFFDFIY